MSKRTAATPTHRTPPEIDDAFLNFIDKNLLALEKAIAPASQQLQIVLDKLSPRLFSMHEKGFSFREISSILNRYNIELSDIDIRNHFAQAHVRRLEACEQILANGYKPGGVEATERSTAIENELCKSMKNGRDLFLQYQPQVNLTTGAVLGVEALVRWQLNGVLIPASEFIPVAENSDLIVELGEWILREACQEAKRWQMMGLGGDQGIRITVNLSVKQLTDGLPNMVHDVLCDTGLPTRLLGLELTESVLADTESLHILQALRNSGIHLSIDDFGTGYSCFSQLKNLPIDTIKIDRAFVVDIGREWTSASSIVESIVLLADKLHMTTVAEGVETMEQADELRKMGCTVCQGFLYSKPLSATDFIEFLKKSNS